MKKNIKKLPIGLAAAALVLTASLTVGGAMGYFTTYSTASGGVTLNMGFSVPEPHETVDEEGKHVTIENVGDYDCFVRVKAFATVDLGYEPGDGWVAGDDGYYEYTQVLEPGESTTELLVTYTLPEAEKDSEGNAIARPDVDITVVQECTPVLYSESGEAYADWTYTVTDAE